MVPSRGHTIRRAAVCAAFLAGLLFATLPMGADGESRRSGSDSPPDGATLFGRHCAACHNGTDWRAPLPQSLAGRSPQAIIDALTSGAMRYQGLALSGLERRAVAEYLTGRTAGSVVTGDATGRCARAAAFSDVSAGPMWNGWSPAIDSRHFQSIAQAGLSAGQVPSLKLKWAFGFPDASASWAPVTIAGGRAFVGSQNGTVYSLDAKTGCIAWTFTARAGVRAAIVVDRIGQRDADRRRPSYLAYVADQAGYVYALDAASGQMRWTRKVDDHPLVRLTGSPVVYRGRIYVPTSSYEEGGRSPGSRCCTFRGSLVALDAGTGEIVWKSFTIQQPAALQRVYADGTELWGPSGGAIWSAPTVDVKRGAIYVGVGNAYSGPPQKTADAIVAFDLKTGAMRWTRQMSPGERDVFGCVPGHVNCGEKPGPDFDFGASPALARLSEGGDLIIAGQKSGVLYALDPNNRGQIVWRYRAGSGSGLGGIQWGVAADSQYVYAPVAEIYSEMPGGLHAVELSTGKRVWYAPPPPPVCGKPSRACSGALFSAITVIPGVIFSPSNDGAIRAYSTADGSLVWQFDTNREFMTINGVTARGGSMSGPAPSVAGGMVYVESGYGTFGLRPGNVLLAFGLD